MLQVKFFAMLRGIAGVESKEFDISAPVTVRELKEIILADIPALTEALESRSMLISVNQEVAHDNDTVSDGDEVAFLPPFSGG
ncbi:MAG: MoaD/ThiS family protein [Proteobacteria bacterium]|nr:MoaD/ThiS family protein [Pseudomonadota bacterium]